MAIEHNEQQELSQSFLLDALYCEEEEEKWGDLVDDETIITPLSSEVTTTTTTTTKPNSLLPLLLLEQDLFWEDEELLSLFSKEKETHCWFNSFQDDSLLCSARVDSVEWILKVNGYYGFSALTAVLAINYFDRFLTSLHYQKDKPWMIQLAAVTCLSLAAKVEETQVPLLLDFQVEDAKYVFEAKTIQRMELLVLSSLKWRMNPVTPLSFLDHIIRRLGLRNNIHWEFLRRCENLLLSIMADCRFVRYMPSVLATAIMLHVIHQVEPCNSVDYQNQLLGVLKINKEKVNNCFELISEVCSKPISHKRKYENPSHSPSGVIDPIYSSESSNDSWDLESTSSYFPVFKKSRVQEQQMKLASSISRVFVEAVGSPH
ncbi:cyclin-D3-2-like [Nicotiana sylvestris]|uniref:Cyclin D3.1 protein n=2 Tax=Nicotiana TaxID=4085 RepID=Q9ZRX8_TOBAC|nr:PREDICTED: cyclin-D3-2-like [Nicotiana sylvestris]CAA09853.1 cyclin D3.1 protein [Nicotiana tabacum]